MLNSLRFRLIAMTVIAAAISVACVGVLSRYLTLVEFRKYVTKNPVEETAKLEGLRLLFEKQFRQNGTRENAQEFVENVGRASDKQIILVDRERRILAVYPVELRQANIQISPAHKLTLERAVKEGNTETIQASVFQNVPHAELHDGDGKHFGTIYSAAFPNIFPEQKEEVFISGLNRTLLWASLLSAIVAAIVAVFFARRILRPIENLIAAVGELEKGNLNRRVETISKDEIGRLGTAFNSMANKLSRQDELRRTMINDVAHELRTPLTNIRCHIETVQDGLARPTPEVINSLHDEAMLLNRLIDDLQDLALAESGRLKIEPQRIAVDELVGSAIAAARLQGAKAPTIIKDVSRSCPDLSGDVVRLGQVFRNLLNNSIVHTPAAGKITIRARRVDSEIEFLIEDTGGGITPEDLPFVFERFYRADASRSRSTGGAGLGLAIVKQIITAHDGRIWIESNPGEGTKIYFTLPLSLN